MAKITGSFGPSPTTPSRIFQFEAKGARPESEQADSRHAIRQRARQLSSFNLADARSFGCRPASDRRAGFGRPI